MSVLQKEIKNVIDGVQDKNKCTRLEAVAITLADYDQAPPEFISYVLEQEIKNIVDDIQDIDEIQGSNTSL